MFPFFQGISMIHTELSTECLTQLVRNFNGPDLFFRHSAWAFRTTQRCACRTFRGVLSPTPENRTRDGTVDWNVSGLVVDRSFSVGGQNAVIERFAKYTK